MPTSSALVLFDIDGTLLITRGATSRCIHRACREIFGEQFEWGPITVGTLDPQIFADLCVHNGIRNAEEYAGRYRDCYLRELERELERVKADVTVLPGVSALLESLRQRHDVVLGLLTGNYREAARLKLEAAGIDWEWFGVGAFAESGQCRDDLVRAAMGQYQDLTGRGIAGRQVIVIGDTPRDVACATQHGCRSVAVATGRYSVEQLRQTGAERVVATLEDAQPLLIMLDEMART